MNRKKIKSASVCLALLIAAVLTSCKKDFLNVKPSTSLVQPHTITDFQQLLSNTEVFNQTGALPLASSDEFIIPDYATYQSLVQLTTRNAYTWEKDLYGGQGNVKDWNIPYAAIFYANSVLDGLPNSDGIGTSEWNKTKGWAYFARAFAFYDLAQNFCEAYDGNTAGNSPGVPLRLTSGIDELLPRATLQQTYDQLLSDLQQAGRLLPNNLSVDFRNQPSKAAVYALFARIYLSMREYPKAEAYADSCLLIYNKLIDYNTVSKTASTPFTFSNNESIYYSVQTTDLTEVISSSLGRYAITPELLSLYDANDLRKPIYFGKAANGTTLRKRTYSGRSLIYTGLATDELYLIKAECAARRSAVQTALSSLNTLLITRYTSGTFTPRSASDPATALAMVLTERQKELIRRGLRWSDLKRLNKEGANITITRILNGKTYTLPPNDPRYLFPIPDDEINYSGISQNPR
ncbi:RagB/SusD family nutrient uptake outer membrane protein [Mucilaginibacter sp. ZT4R22]|uniref:RagB/SusD family nutrient uptake outer membrane protein n=1 Tax=Mucilaginibacter pankratovii TaxID=2772110 RepID=A0ABR7WJS8_9SPHI|nr:RagB/SusD family nutrient uptake outer membrane protein [Mucilaginibacter pankratovii]MBD1362574.1 RagB/SusD family nutrient uptake outer membrane protein [Mucilaginibacter pankratovii]